jgi:hypothetical protein
MNEFSYLNLEKYIGVPYSVGGKDLRGFDCLGLVDYVLEKELNVKLSHGLHETKRTDVFLKENFKTLVKNLNEFHFQTHKPENFDLVIMKKDDMPIHIGLFFKFERFCGVLHAMGSGNKGSVVFQRIVNSKIEGWINVIFYKLC